MTHDGREQVLDVESRSRVTRFNYGRLPQDMPACRALRAFSTATMHQHFNVGALERQKGSALSPRAEGVAPETVTLTGEDLNTAGAS